MRFIKELYHGNIEPQAKSVKRGSSVGTAMETLSRSEALLTEQLDGELKQHFSEYTTAWAEINSAGEEESFCSGFRLGAALVFDLLQGESDNFESYMEG